MPPLFRIVFLIVVLFWLASGVGDDSTSTTSNASRGRVFRLRQAFDTLQTTGWGDFSPRRLGDLPEQPSEPAAESPSPDKPDSAHGGGDNSDSTGTHGPHYRYLNMTGFRENDGYAWEDLGRFRERCWEWIRNMAPQDLEMDRKEGIQGSTERWWLREGSLAAIGPTWQNIVGSVRGDWVRQQGSALRYATDYKLGAIEPSVRWLAGDGQEWNRNVSGAHGRMTLRFMEMEQSRSKGSKPDDKHDNATISPANSPFFAREISANVTVQDNDKRGSMWDMAMHGVHWPRQGVLMLTTTSDKFSGIFGLPHLSPGPDFYQSSQRLLNESLAAVHGIKRSDLADPSNALVSSPSRVVDDGRDTMPHCEYVMFVLVHPIDPLQLGVIDGGKPPGREQLRGLIDDLEVELQSPTGAPVKTIPEMRMSAVVWSPDCSYFLVTKGPPLYHAGPDQRSQHLVGWKAEVYQAKIKAWLLTYAVVFMGQRYLVTREARRLFTPPALNRVSAYTLGWMITADVAVFFAVLLSCTVTTDSFLACAVLTLASGLMTGSFCVVFYMVYKNMIRHRDREWSQSAGNSARLLTGPIPTPPAVLGQPPPPPPPPPLSQPAPRHQPRTAENPHEAAGEVAGSATSFWHIMGVLIFLAVVFVFFCIASSSWPVALREGFFNTSAFLTLTIWLPQIRHNIMRNSRCGLSWQFILGQSLVRACPVVFFYGDYGGFSLADPDAVVIPVLAGCLFIQFAALAYQDRLGPRYGLPKTWLPRVWDYHPIFSEDGAEAGNYPIGGSDASGAPGSSSPQRSDGSWPHDRDPGAGEGLASTSGHIGDRELGKDRERSGGVQMRAFTCPICHEMIEVPLLGTSHDRSAYEERAARAYMYTPCRHIFHTECLTCWLERESCCPICRQGLPSL